MDRWCPFNLKPRTSIVRGRWLSYRLNRSPLGSHHAKAFLNLVTWILTYQIIDLQLNLRTRPDIIFGRLKTSQFNDTHFATVRNVVLVRRSVFVDLRLGGKKPSRYPTQQLSRHHLFSNSPAPDVVQPCPLEGKLAFSLNPHNRSQFLLRLTEIHRGHSYARAHSVQSVTHRLIQFIGFDFRFSIV